MKSVYINAYEVSQSYGGPEEGGWYYDIGTVLGSIPMKDPTDDQIQSAITYLKNVLDNKWYSEQLERTSAAGNGIDLIISVEDHVAVDFPSARPHYE